MAPGAFLVLGFLVAGMNIIRKKMEAKGTPLAEPAGCLSGDCAHCGASCPSAKAAQTAVAPKRTDTKELAKYYVVNYCICYCNEQ